MQWRSENESKVIGSYEPKYEKNDKGHLAEWDSIEIKWYTANGQQPADRLRECAILTDFANAMDLKCENAISLAFVAGFGSLFILVLLIFVILKRRYVHLSYIYVFEKIPKPSKWLAAIPIIMHNLEFSRVRLQMSILRV